ncbi:hypothetical protein PR202_gb29490 [Eleusine coracana subsp. coracana]|uniref:Uncharacterized protein n=1 Tax=Eleusine coracana subsp. coracana TaxID=191504 RepID=A0AAV5FZ65_ELECO|nr:hypothetical protein PR202_gb29490 [Eleusine coracana subsp. coracana]
MEPSSPRDQWPTRAWPPPLPSMMSKTSMRVATHVRIRFASPDLRRIEQAWLESHEGGTDGKRCRPEAEWKGSRVEVEWKGSHGWRRGEGERLDRV